MRTRRQSGWDIASSRTAISRSTVIAAPTVAHSTTSALRANFHVQGRRHATGQCEEDAEGQTHRPGQPLSLDLAGDTGEQESKEGREQPCHQPEGNGAIQPCLPAHICPEEARPVLQLPLPGGQQSSEGKR